MIIITLLLIAESVMVVLFIRELILMQKFRIFRIFIKFKYSYYDYHFMANLSMGVFASSLVAIVVSEGGFVIAYFVMAIVSFKAMIDYNYKCRYNK